MKKIIAAMQRLFKKQSESVRKEVQTHDFSNPGWGHAIYYKVLNGGLVLDGYGFLLGVEVGDYVIIRKGDGSTARYKVDKIKYCTDPSDMWFGVMSFAPRTFTPDGVQVGE